MNMNLGPNDSGPQMLLPNLIRAVGQALVFPSMTSIATAGIPLKDAGSASVLFNMLRNLGGAIGIAVVQTFLTNREKFHSAIITPDISLLNPATQQRLHMLQNYFMAHGMDDSSAAQAQAIQLLGVTVRLQADYFAYGDAFALMGAAMLVSIAATACLQRATGSGAPGGH
jgi:DHA2 family multidrug resistance protein